jgi:polysaccharide export outer membrane protein
MQKFYRCFLLFIAVSAFCSTAQSQQLNADQYTLGAGDMIEITVFGQEDLTVETRLSNTGTISYPFMGDIELVGLTLNQVEQLIDDGLRGDYLVNPSVSVSVIEYRPFFIDGEVNKPGGYPYQPGLTINKAAALAGGFTERAAKDKVTIVRLIAGQEQTFQAGDKDMIFPGDIVTIQQRFF